MQSNTWRADTSGNLRCFWAFPGSFSSRRSLFLATRPERTKGWHVHRWEYFADAARPARHRAHRAPRSFPARPGWLRGRVPTGVSGQHPASPPSRNRLSLAAEKGPKSVGPGPLPTSSRLPLCMRVRTQRHVPWFTRQKCLCDLL